MSLFLRRFSVFIAFLALPLIGFAQAAKLDVESEMKKVNEGSRRYSVKVFAIQNPEQIKTASTGSGELVRGTDGVVRVLTNHHVVGASPEFVWVQFERQPAAQKVRVIGRDEQTDLALLEAPNPLPDSAKAIPIAQTPLVIGDRVYSVGYPSGNRSVAMGHIVSLTSEHEDVGVGIYFTHQTPISPGSSGGVLVRITTTGAEELVGINTQVAVAVVAEGEKLVTNLGFSIRPSVVERMIAKLETEQRVSHSFMGFLVQDTVRANPFLYEKYTQQPYPPARNNIFVVQVTKESPAGRAGIQLGDFIRRFEVFLDSKWISIPFTKASELRDATFFEVRPGTRVRVSTQRGTQEMVREFVIEAYPSLPPSPRN